MDFELASKTSNEDTESFEGPAGSRFGFVNEPQMSLGDLYILSPDEFVMASDLRPSDLPSAFVFVVSLINYYRLVRGCRFCCLPFEF